MTETFEQFLDGKCFKENPQILDDDRPDFFEGWLEEQQIDDMIKYGQEYGDKRGKV